MDLFSYQLGKKAGGGETPATLIDKNISANGTYNASSDEADGYKKVVVDVEPNLQNKTATITTNTTTTISADSGYDGLGQVEVTTNVPMPPQPTLIQKTITTNGTYNATDDNADGYSSVTVETSGVDINDYFDTTFNEESSSGDYSWWKRYFIKKAPKITGNSTYMAYAFENAPFKEIDCSALDTSNNTTFQNFCYNCVYLEKIDISNFDYSNIVSFNGMFFNCTKLVEIKGTISAPKTYAGAYMSQAFSRMFSKCTNLKKLELGLINLQSYYTDNMFSQCKKLAVLDLSNIDNLQDAYSPTQMFENVGINCLQSDGAYANGIPYVYVKDATAQNWVLTANNGHPSTWTTANVIIKNT